MKRARNAMTMRPTTIAASVMAMRSLKCADAANLKTIAVTTPKIAQKIKSQTSSCPMEV